MCLGSPWVQPRRGSPGGDGILPARPFPENLSHAKSPTAHAARPRLFALLASGPVATAQAVEFRRQDRSIRIAGIHALDRWVRVQHALLLSGAQGSHAVGTSKRYNGAARPGCPVDGGPRHGLHLAHRPFLGAEFTNSSDTSQITSLYKWREEGFAYGISSRFNGAQDAGSGVWVSLTADRITKRVGFTPGRSLPVRRGSRLARPASPLQPRMSRAFLSATTARPANSAGRLG